MARRMPALGFVTVSDRRSQNVMAGELTARAGIMETVLAWSWSWSLSLSLSKCTTEGEGASIAKCFGFQRLDAYLRRCAILGFVGLLAERLPKGYGPLSGRLRSARLNSRQRQRQRSRSRQRPRHVHDYVGLFSIL
jgi:hypothetical protein